MKDPIRHTIAQRCADLFAGSVPLVMGRDAAKAVKADSRMVRVGEFVVWYYLNGVDGRSFQLRPSTLPSAPGAGPLLFCSGHVRDRDGYITVTTCKPGDWRQRFLAASDA